MSVVRQKLRMRALTPDDRQVAPGFYSGFDQSAIKPDGNGLVDEDDCRRTCLKRTQFPGDLVTPASLGVERKM